MQLRFVVVGILSSLAVLGTVAPAYAFEVPPNDGFVTDEAGILSPEDKLQIAETLQTYQDQTSNQIAILIVNTLSGEPIADVAVQVGRKWGVGTKDKSNGILLLIAYQDREVFLATGYGLEGAVPDLATKGIIEQDMAPLFRNGNYAEGIRAAVTSLQKLIGGEYTADRYAQNTSEGGGPVAFIFFLGVLVLQWLLSFLGRTKSWWLGGALGAISGLVLAFIYTWWWSIPALFVLGLLIDLIASKTYKPGRPGRRGGPWGMGGGGFGSGGSGGGFGGFGGGSFGGGGAGGKW